MAWGGLTDIRWLIDDLNEHDLHAKRADATFHVALVSGEVQKVLAEDVETALGQSRGVMNATVGFEVLSR